jgi:hypothetical protein
MSKTVAQIFSINPTTVVADTDLYYLVQSPYTLGSDAAITGASLKAAFGAGGTINPGLINQLAYYASSGSTLSGLATLANGTLITSGGGAPSISQTLPSVVQGNITTLGTIISGTWNGSIIGGTYGGTGVNNGASTITIGGNVTFSGAFTFTGTLTGNTSVTFPTSGTLATTSQLPTPSALTKVDDTNVTLTLGGTPTTALLQAVSLTLGWTGQLGLTRGGTNASLTASNGGIVWSNASQLQILSGTATANQVLLSGSSVTPAWSTATYPPTTTINQLLYSSSSNVIGGLATVNSASLTTTSGGVPTWLALTDGQIIIGSSIGAPAAATITAGTGVSVTNGHNTITIAATGGTGTVTSISAGTGITCTPNPITGTGTVALTTPVSLTNGGTNASLTASNGGIVWSNASQLQILSGTATANQVLLSGSTATPAWSTATYPATTTINQILYSSSANVIAGLATGNNGVLVTSAAGVPSINTSLAQGLVVSSSVLTVGAANNIPFNTGKGIQDNNANSLLLFTVTASAVNYVNIQNNSTTNKPIILGTGSDTNVLLSLQNKGNSGVEIQGTTAAGNATAGFVGEVISSVIASASAVSLSNGIAKDMTSISLTAGDWDVWGNIFFTLSVGGGSTIAWTSTTSATKPDNSLVNQIAFGTGTEASTGMSVPMVRVNISSTTTVFISGVCSFGSGTCTMCGGIYARRKR